MIEYCYTKYKKLNPVGDCVLIEKLNEDSMRMSHGLFLPDTKKFKNDKIGVGKIIGISKKAKKETGLDVGDYILYDYFSVFNDNSKNVLTRYENLIMKLNEKEAENFLIGK